MRAGALHNGVSQVAVEESKTLFGAHALPLWSSAPPRPAPPRPALPRALTRTVRGKGRARRCRLAGWRGGVG